MSYFITKADFSMHREDIISLWRRNFTEMPEGRFLWIYEKNPAGPPICYVLRCDTSDSVVGAITLFPRTVIVNGRGVQAFICGDFAVDKMHRALGPALLLLKAAIAKCDENAEHILLGFTSKASEAVTLRAGFQVLGKICQMTKIIKTDSYIQKYVDFPFITKALAYPSDLLLHFRYNQKVSGTYKYEILDEFDERVDDLWKQTKNMFSLRGESSSTYLNWRFSNSSNTKQSIFIMTSKYDRNILGYFVYCSNKQRVQINDFAFIENELVPSELISLFTKHHKSNGAESIAISFAGNPNYAGKFINCGFFNRPNKQKTIIYASSGQDEIIAEINKGNWYLSMGDNDI